MSFEPLNPIAQPPTSAPTSSTNGLPSLSNIENSGTTFDPKAYASLNDLVQRRGWDRMLSTISSFPANARVLDLGFGHGGNTAELATTLRTNGGTIFGIEPSEVMVTEARAKYPAETHPNLTLLHGRAEAAGEAIRSHARLLDLSDPRFDIVVSNYTLHWVRDPSEPRTFLHKEMFRSLNKLQPIGGAQHHFCAEQDAFKELFAAGYALIREESRWRGYFTPHTGDYVEGGEWRHPPLISRDALYGALRGGGYEGTIERCEDERIFTSRESLVGWVGAMIRPFMNKIPAEEKGAFVNGWINRYLEDNPSAARTSDTGQQSFVLWDRNLLVMGWKVAELE
jgi:trans-aconitate methyltransferase